MLNLLRYLKAYRKLSLPDFSENNMINKQLMFISFYTLVIQLKKVFRLHLEKITALGGSVFETFILVYYNKLCIIIIVYEINNDEFFVKV